MSDVLKALSFSLGLFLGGFGLLLVALIAPFTVGSVNVPALGGVVRVVAGMVGAALMATSIWLEVKKTFAGTSPVSGKAKNAPAPFFHTLDERLENSFPKMVEGAIRVRILSRTAVNLLGQYRRDFEVLAQRGCEVQLLFVDPSCDASRFLYGTNPEVFRQNAIMAAEHIQRIQGAGGRRMTVRLTQHAPTVSIILIEKNEAAEGFAQVQLYFLHAAVGRDRPIFRIPYGDRLYRVFQEEFQQLWSDAKDRAPHS